MFESSTEKIPEGRMVPRHIAIIMDGNGRWAKRRFLPRMAGHKRGVEAVRRVVTACGDRGEVDLVGARVRVVKLDQRKQRIGGLLVESVEHGARFAARSTALQQEMWTQNGNQRCFFENFM